MQYRCSDRATIDAVLFIIRQHKNFYIEEHTITEADAAASTDVAMAATALTPHHSYRRYCCTRPDAPLPPRTHAKLCECECECEFM